MSAWRLIARALLPRVIGYGRWERLVMRVAFALVVYFSIRWGVNFDGQPRPNGLAHWIDFTFISGGEYKGVLKVFVALSLLVYALGVCPALTLLLPLAVSIASGTLVNSQGAINHDKQIVSLVMIGQVATSAFAVFRGGGFLRLTALWENRLVHVTKTVIIAAYVVSAAVKIDESDGAWIWEDVPRLSVQFRKTNLSKESTDLTPVDPFAGVTLPDWISEHPYQAMAVFGSGLLLELFCFVGLAGRKWAFFTGLSLVAMHLSIGRLMQLHFDNNVALLVIFFINFPGLTTLFQRGEQSV